MMKSRIQLVGLSSRVATPPPGSAEELVKPGTDGGADAGLDQHLTGSLIQIMICITINSTLGPFIFIPRKYKCLNNVSQAE